MAQLIVANLEDDVHDLLQNLAHKHGHSIEEEARNILRGAVLGSRVIVESNLGSRFAGRFTDIGLEHSLEKLPSRLIEPLGFDR